MKRFKNKIYNQLYYIKITVEQPFKVNVTNDIGAVDRLPNGILFEVFVQLLLVLQKLEVALNNVEIISTSTLTITIVNKLGGREMEVERRHIWRTQNIEITSRV